MGRSKKTPPEAQGPLAAVRVDKWLWSARMYKTRTMATEACSSGNVKVNRAVAKASQKVKAGDEISALTPGGRRILRVQGLAEPLLLFDSRCTAAILGRMLPATAEQQ